MFSSIALPRGYDLLATKPARNNSKTSPDDVDVNLYDNSSSSSLAMDSETHSLGADCDSESTVTASDATKRLGPGLTATDRTDTDDDLESNLSSSSLAMDAGTRSFGTDGDPESTNIISNTNTNKENSLANSDANLQASFTMNSGSEPSIYEDHSLGRTTGIWNTESLTMDYNPNANEDENEDTNENVDANGSSDTDMPLVAVTFFFILGFMMLSVVNAVFQLHHFRLVAMYGLTAIVILGALFVMNGRRRDTANLYTDAHVYDIDDKFPTDSYSFVALYSPKTDPDLFCFGLIVYLFQASLFFLMISSVVHPSLHTTGGVDNPDSEFHSSWFAEFIPSNVSPVIRATQIITILTFLIFPEASFVDISTGILMFPQLWKMYGNEKVWCMAFSCVLRSIQGFMAIFAIFVLIMTSSDVTQIVLSFIAVSCNKQFGGEDNNYSENLLFFPKLLYFELH